MVKVHLILERGDVARDVVEANTELLPHLDLLLNRGQVTL